MVGGPGGASLPRRAALLVRAVLALATLALVAAVASLPRGLAGEELARLLAAVAFATATMFFLQTRSLTLPWAGERIAIHPDEAVLLVALYFLPSGAAVVVAAAATLLSQSVLRKAPVKAAFNAGIVTLAAGVAVGAAEALVALGVTRLLALAVAPILFTAVSQGLVALMLALVSDRPSHTAFGPALARSTLIAGGAGLLMGAIAIALLQVHWAAVIIVAGLAAVFHRAMAAEYRHESELAARRALHGAMDKLAGVTDEERIVLAVHEACREAFALRRFEVRIQHMGRAARTWVLPPDAPEQRADVSYLRAPLVTATGARVGEMVLTVDARGRRRLKEDQELLAIYAGYLAAAAGQAEALRLLAEAKQQLVDVFDAAPDPIVVVDGHSKRVHSNHAALSAFGDVVPRIGEDATATTPDGRVFEFTAAQLALPGGTQGAILMARDVTERRRAEELLRRHERLSSLGTLVAGVAHEINNPLMYIEGHLELALAELDETEPDRAQLKEAIGIALNGARRIEFISKGLRAVARSAPARQEPVRLNQVVEEVANLLRAALPPNVALVVDVDPADPVVQGDPSELHQVVVNLARNAIEAVAPAGGHVALTTRDRDGVAEIEVSDDGPGVPPEARAKLFTPFYTTKAEGTGLGLAITHSLVQAHRGELVLESEPAQGATFRVRIPRPLMAPRR